MMMEAVPTAEAPEGEAALAEAVQDEVSKTFVPQGEPHMVKVTCFSAVLNGKTKYRRIHL